MTYAIIILVKGEKKVSLCFYAHQLGNHTYSHKALICSSITDNKKEIIKGERLLNNL